MDREAAIETNRTALAAIVAALFAMLDLADGTILARIPKSLNNAVLHILRAAEAATRRLIVVMARGMAIKPYVPRHFPKDRVIPTGNGRGGGKRPPAFRLTDRQEPLLPQRHKRRPPPIGPRISLLGHDPTIPAMLAWQVPSAKPESKARRGPKPRPDDGFVDSARLARRLLAIKAALEDLSRQATRLNRWKARREWQVDQGRLVRTSPLREVSRSGIIDPPSYRQPPDHGDPIREEAENIFWDCVSLVRETEKQPQTNDTS
jgi:hypothetical protein